MISATCILVRERPLDPKSEWPSSLATDQVENPGLTFSSRPLLCLEMSYFQKYLTENVRVVHLVFFQNLNTGLPLLHWPLWKYNPLALSCDLGLSSCILKNDVCLKEIKKSRKPLDISRQCEEHLVHIKPSMYDTRICWSLNLPCYRGMMVFSGQGCDLPPSH